MRRKKRRKKIYALLVLLGVTIGYALLSTTLKINGIAGIKSNTWDIHWDDESIQEAEGIVSPVSGATVTDAKKTIVEFGVEFELPGDFYEFYIDAVNEGSIDGEITLILDNVYESDGVTPATLPDYIKYSVVYADNEEEPKLGDILKKNDIRTYKVRVEYDDEATTLPSSDVTYKFSVQIKYSQSTGNNETGDTVGGKGPGVEKLENKVNDNDPKEPKNFTEPVTPTKPQEVSQRYTGADPNNYIYFNCDSLEEQNSSTCEMWRIIGVDNNKIRIIKNDSIGNKQWNDTEFDIAYEGPYGSIYGVINNWDESTLKEYLNGTYYNGLKTTAKKLISTETWYTNGYSTVKANIRWRDPYDEYEMYFRDPMFADSAYINERTQFVNAATSSWIIDNVSAKVGLMYASDYGYASSACHKGCLEADDGDCSVRNSFKAYDMIGGSGNYSYHEEECVNSNWLYKGVNEWTMTPYLETIEGGQGYVINIYERGSIEWTPANSGSYAVRPVVYLKKGVDLEGSGSISDPFKVKASNNVLDNDDDTNTGGSSGGSGGSSNGVTPSASGSGSNQSCTDTTKPTCTLNYVQVKSNGFRYSFSCTDDTEMNRITSLFDHDPYNGQYDSTTFDRIGSVKNGIVVNGGKTKSYSSQWTTANPSPPSRSTCYYFSYGGEDKCGNWVVYHTPSCYQY